MEQDSIKRLEGTRTVALVMGVFFLYRAEVSQSGQWLLILLAGLLMTMGVFDELALLRAKNPNPEKANPMLFLLFIGVLAFLIIIPVYTGISTIRYFKASNGVSYAVKKDVGHVRKIYGNDQVVAIEEEWKGVPVEVIDHRAFAFRISMEQVELPKGLKIIRNGAFYDCFGLTEVTLPDGLEEIENGAFENCKNLKRVIVPASVKEIPSKAFKGCPEDLVIVGEAGSAAQSFGEEYYRFEPIQ